MAVVVAGAAEPLADLLRAEAAEDGAGPARLIGSAQTAGRAWAVLINGAASHALDYDDVNQMMHGHPTVAIMPALLTAAEQCGASGRDVLDAFVVGYEVACRIGRMTGDGHYHAGFHATGTVGTFGAAAGVARLIRLDARQTAHALGIAAAQAAGLKSMFGTMTKPLHAGKAAQNGYLAARLAARGYTANPDALETAQGFWATQAPGARPAAMRPDPKAAFAIESNLFKYHAACYLTHSSIEACRKLRADHGFSAADVKRVRLRVDEGHLAVCNIEEPEDGLQTKFSLRQTAAMALGGIDTAAMESFSTENANREDLVALRRKVRVEPRASAPQERAQAEVVVDLADGRALLQHANVAVPASDLDWQWQSLAASRQAP
jgi:2-methylcitrate dehydratase PrpD